MERQTLLSQLVKGSKTTLWQHCKQIESITGKWPEAWLPIEPPEDFRFIWDIFWELRNQSKAGFSGPDSLSFTELDAWQRIRGFRLGNWAVDMMLAMDSAFMQEWHKQQDKKNG